MTAWLKLFFSYVWTAFVSGQSGESDLITEETSNVIPAKTDREADIGSSAIVIQVSDGDSEASKGIIFLWIGNLQQSSINLHIIHLLPT